MPDITWSAAMMVDAVIGVTVIEAAVLWSYHRATGKGISGRHFMLNLLSGLLLMVALRAHIGGAPGVFTAGLLAASGIAHATDMWRRWQH
jgi:hypothetical protein